ncbi:hypothetical protein BRADI_1g57081v3 [Brachypodium distachyon]|uniref:Uncharacterized protein n=1 Tax=Brachypodium distachyon TaxID=15368 RepID=A0A2K2DRY9_BRADI|nr:hypothetical protein BRADI_1g57081v3 [Brachypodium distachyon]
MLTSSSAGHRHNCCRFCDLLMPLAAPSPTSCQSRARSSARRHPEMLRPCKPRHGVCLNVLHRPTEP